MSIECQWNVQMTSKIKIFDIWSVRKWSPLVKNVIFQCSTSGDLGPDTQFFWKHTKVEKSFENEVPNMFKYVFRRKWCAALSSVVCPGAPFGQSFKFNANLSWKIFQGFFVHQMSTKCEIHIKNQDPWHIKSHNNVFVDPKCYFSVFNFPGLWPLDATFLRGHKSWKFIRKWSLRAQKQWFWFQTPKTTS